MRGTLNTLLARLLIGSAIAVLWAAIGAGLGRKQSQIEAQTEPSRGL